MKYRPDQALIAFENLMAAPYSVTQLVHWYNHQHWHSAIKFVTTAEPHAKQDVALLAKRREL